MKTQHPVTNLSNFGASVLLAVLLVGCATETTERSGAVPRVVISGDALSAGAPLTTVAGRFRRASAAFPSGNPQTSALLVEKTVPAEVLVGQPFEIVYKVSNLTDMVLEEVTLTDNTPANFKLGESTPKADKISGSEVTWIIGELAPRQSKEIRIKGTALQEGVITGCGTATFRPILCETIKVVKPAIQLVKTMPATVVQCDPIPVKLVVNNTGSSVLTQVRVTDSLPEGLLTDANQNKATFEAGTLAPGQSREFTFAARATKTGSFSNPAKATSAEGVEAAAQASVRVVKPSLTLNCQTPPQKEAPNLKFTQYIGRPFEVCWEVKNTGDAPSAGTIVEVQVPAGLTFRSATDNGTVTGSTLTWNLGSLAPGASKKVCANFTGANGGSYAFKASGRGVCADLVTSDCGVFIQGVNAILVEVVDDPDPIQVGEQTTYTIRIVNQGGGLDLLGVAVKAVLPAEINPVTASSGGQISGKTVTWAQVARLPLKQSLTYTIVGKAVAAGDARLKVEVVTSDRQVPITELESTTTY